MDAADFGSLLFSFRGRVNRAKWWLAMLIYVLVTFVSLAFSFMAMADAGMVGAGLTMAFGLATLISSIAVGIKRLHDRNKSGWWLLLFYLVPAIVGILGGAIGEESPVALLLALVVLAIYVWAFIELACLRGTIGPNKYGPDPLEADETQPAVTA